MNVLVSDEPPSLAGGVQRSVTDREVTSHACTDCGCPGAAKIDIIVYPCSCDNKIGLLFCIAITF